MSDYVRIRELRKLVPELYKTANKTIWWWGDTGKVKRVYSGKGYNCYNVHDVRKVLGVNANQNP